MLKRCPYCRRLFKADPRTEYEQRVCSGAECQKQRKRDYQKKWREKNPKYFQGHYSRLKRWLDKHPDYLKNYRHNNQNHGRIHKKEETRPKEILPLEAHAGLEARIVEMEQIFRNLPCSDIQIPIESRNPELKPFCAQFTHG